MTTTKKVKRALHDPAWCAHAGMPCTHRREETMGDGTLCMAHAAERQIAVIEHGVLIDPHDSIRALLWKIKELETRLSEEVDSIRGDMPSADDR
jgi:hypothetical protein